MRNVPPGHCFSPSTPADPDPPGSNARAGPLLAGPFPLATLKMLLPLDVPY